MCPEITKAIPGAQAADLDKLQRERYNSFRSDAGSHEHAADLALAEGKTLEAYQAALDEQVGVILRIARI